MELTVGLIGVGRIGLPVYANLVAAGYTVIAAGVRSDRKPRLRGRRELGF